MVCMSDSAQAYTVKPWGFGIVDAHHVNHSQKPKAEYARPVMAISDVETREVRSATASTCIIDPIWRRLKEELPGGGVSAKTEDGRVRITQYIRAGQWKLMLSTGDRWGPFCAAAALSDAEAKEKNKDLVSCLGNFAHKAAAALSKRKQAGGQLGPAANPHTNNWKRQRGALPLHDKSSSA